MLNQKTSDFCSQLDIKLPIIQAPMAGGIVSPELIAEVNKYGGLGSLPLGYLAIEDAQQAIRNTKVLTAKQFAVNIFIPSPSVYPSHMQVTTMLAHINKYRLSLGRPALAEIPPWIEPDIDELLAMIIGEGITIISFTFGVLNKSAMKRLHKENIFVIGTATTVQEGLRLEEAGCHAVIAQGYEAGGHRGGGFLKGHSGGLIGTMALIPPMVDALKIPVIASGGIMDGRGIAAGLILGASAVQMGTAFLTCQESMASPMHKKMLLDSPAENTCITAVFTGKPVRSFGNDFISNSEKLFKKDELLPYPLQHQITKDLRSNANKLNRQEYAGLWSGQGTGLSRSMSVQALIATLERETLSALRQFKL